MKRITLITLLPFLLSSCLFSVPKLPDLPKIITPYKDNLNQGSILEKAKIEQLEIGMTKAQVQALIGSPSIIDPFHNNQWDYVNHSTIHKKDNIHYRLTLQFNNDILAKIDSSGINSLPPPAVKIQPIQP